MSCPACKAQWTLGPRYLDLNQGSERNLSVTQPHNLHISCYLRHRGIIAMESLSLLALLAQMWLYTGLTVEVCR